jgi:hypothetical protein
MAKRSKEVAPARVPVKAKGQRQVSAQEDRPTFAEIEEAHAREAEQEQSSKRRREKKDVSVAGGSRAERPRSGRSGSQSNASRRTRGH